jgi:hypothetical protein
MKAATLVVLWLGMLGTSTGVLAASCSSYYISEITLVSTADTEAGHVQTFVGFGLSKEEAEKNVLGISFDLQTCLDSDRSSGRKAPSDAPDNLLPGGAGTSV